MTLARITNMKRKKAPNCNVNVGLSHNKKTWKRFVRLCHLNGLVASSVLREFIIEESRQLKLAVNQVDL